jgi:stage II sporulation protein D
VRALGALLLCLPLAAAPGTLKVRVGQSTIEMPLEKYVAAVLAGESSSFRSDEALKAMAVAARSYGLHFRGRHASEGFDLCATTHCQRVDPDAVTARLVAAAEQTAGEVLWYEGKPVFACYSRNCGGITEDASAVWSDLAAPFLRSHADPYCTRQGSTSWEWSGAAGEIAAALQRALLKAPQELTRITIAQRTTSGRARVLLLGGAGESVPVAASSFRFALGRTLGWNTVRSDRFEVSDADGRLMFRGFGDGHGVGLCQQGADQMGREGMGYRDILAFYFPRTVLAVTGRGLAWVRLSGEVVSLFSTQPEQDRAVLAIAERQVREIAGETRWTVGGAIEIRVYPDVETFRNATGEPGWVAAHTSGRRVELQPAGVLRGKRVLESTVRHELLHVFVEEQAKAGLPVWFREGLVGYLERRHGGAAEVSEADLRQTGDEARARRAYAAAAQRVTELVQKYGSSTVFAWLKTGMPK